MQIDINTLLDLDIQWTPKTIIVRKYRITSLLKDKVIDKVVQIVHDKTSEGKCEALRKALEDIGGDEI